ncbi:DUF6916 family protein [Bacterioplanoides pacificum]|uniref:DUF6916 family protein n=1 Tax=Bacterioplanoides pacificum TaxID=1171596 RepID=A0ABV7VZE4_9GAMM
MNHSSFLSALHQDFQLADADGITLTLKEVGDCKENAKWQSFSVLFSSPDVLPQATYQLHNPTLGDIEIFLVPIGKYFPDSDELVYESIFNLAADET